METFERFRTQHTVVLTTFKHDGTSVPTPVSIAVDADPTRAYVRTRSTAGKAKRIVHNPRVTVAPSTFRGRITGAEVTATARLLSGAEGDHAAPPPAPKASDHARSARPARPPTSTLRDPTLRTSTRLVSDTDTNEGAHTPDVDG